MESTQVAKIITKNVKSFYEQFPYPNYPILARPRWQEAYLSSSAWQDKLINESSKTFASSGFKKKDS